MEVSEAKRLRQLEEENHQLKHTVAELLLDKRALQAVVAKNGEPGAAEGSGGSDALGSRGLRATRLRADPDSLGGRIGIGDGRRTASYECGCANWPKNDAGSATAGYRCCWCAKGG